MKKPFLLAGAALVGATLLSGTVLAQGTPQTIATLKVDTASLATGYRTSKVVGSVVVNDANQTIGKVDDLIVTPGQNVPYAILSVGGFLGIGSKLVAVPYSAIQTTNNHLTLPGATKDSLKALPPFKYAK